MRIKYRKSRPLPESLISLDLHLIGFFCKHDHTKKVLLLHFQREILLGRQSRYCWVTNPNQQWVVPPEEGGMTSCETYPCQPWRRTHHLHKNRTVFIRGAKLITKLQDKVKHSRMMFHSNLDLTQFWLSGFQRGRDLLLAQPCPSLGTGSVPFGVYTHPPAVWADFFCPWSIPVHLKWRASNTLKFTLKKKQPIMIL